MELIQVFLGLALLLAAGELLVRGAVNLSLRLGVPALIVSLTVVAFGTSAPELLISVQAVLEDAPGIALGNVVGSNTANVLLVLGLPAMIAGFRMTDCDSRGSYALMMGATALFILLCFLGPITWWHGLVLLAALGLVLAGQFREARAHRRSRMAGPAVVEGADPELPGWKIGLFLVLGILGLPLGADLLVTGATSIARALGLAEAAIGLTLVALGTSLPELATTIAAARQRQADVAMGNVIGSNMFNLLGIIGVASLVGAIPVAPGFLSFDLWIMLAASGVLAPFVYLRWTMGRPWGIALCALYVVYVAVVLS